MIRKKLASVPVEKGHAVSFWIIWAYVWFVAGWITHPQCQCWL